MNKQHGYTMFGLLTVCGVFFGLAIGVRYGYSIFGLIGGLVGGVAGCGVGFIVGRLPYIIASYHIQRSFESQSSQRLRERLRDGNEYYIAHLLLAYLMRRGEDITNELPYIISLLKAESFDRRRFGWTALKLAFPKTAAMITEYQPNESTEKCRIIAALLDGKQK